VDAKRDIWQALINEAATSESLPRANDKHFLFVGPEQSGGMRAHGGREKNAKKGASVADPPGALAFA
jgi:hypothetical protein